MDDDKPDDARRATQFRPGNPGRRKGSRNRLGEAFLSALHEDFERHGAKAIARVRDERPHEYLKVIASILPKEIKVSTEIDGLTDEQLDQRIRQLASFLDVSIGDQDPGRYN